MSISREYFIELIPNSACHDAYEMPILGANIHVIEHSAYAKALKRIEELENENTLLEKDRDSLKLFFDKLIESSNKRIEELEVEMQKLRSVTNDILK